MRGIAILVSSFWFQDQDLLRFVLCRNPLSKSVNRIAENRINNTSPGKISQYHRDAGDIRNL
jgi:hypothetical protein